MSKDPYILIVDDEAQVRVILEKLLQRKGYKTQSVANGMEALAYLQNNKINLVISDVVMPQMGGFELLQVIKDRYPDIGVVIMTGYGDAYSVKQALALGADEYITKPFRGTEISLIIERIYWRFFTNLKLTAT